MNNISEITRQDILDIIKDGFIVHLDEPAYDSNVGDYIMEYPVKIPFYGRIDEISFLSRIYDLEKMPSKDSRYRNALGDISCHLRFGDYDDDCWFFSDDRFNLRHGAPSPRKSSALAGLSLLLGHKALTCCMVIANRRALSANTGYKSTIDNLIKVVLDRI